MIYFHSIRLKESFLFYISGALYATEQVTKPKAAGFVAVNDRHKRRLLLDPV